MAGSTRLSPDPLKERARNIILRESAGDTDTRQLRPLAATELLEPLAGKTVLIVGAGGGVGSFATQFAANAGGNVIANVLASDAERMRAYGATETIDHTAAALAGAVRQTHPDGIDVLIDLVNAEPAGFAALASLVRPGGTAVTTQYVADEDALRAAKITGINFACRCPANSSSEWQKPSLTGASSPRQSPVYPWKKRPLPWTPRKPDPPGARP